MAVRLKGSQSGCQAKRDNMAVKLKGTMLLLVFAAILSFLQPMRLEI